MASLESRVNALETQDDDLILFRACPSCGKVVRNDEACAEVPPCELGLPHIEPGPMKPGDIVIKRSYGQP